MKGKKVWRLIGCRSLSKLKSLNREMKYADKQHIAYFLQIESALFYSRSEHTPKGSRATPYSDSGYAVERTELRSTALRATL